ncbi:MAG: lipopolysaccharide biosynthesis protein [Lachnospirales bacterium]
MNNRKKDKDLIIGTITYAIGSFGSKVMSFLIVPLYTYYIMPSDLGDYDLLIATVSLLSPLITMKISEATYRWIINSKDNEVIYISATYKYLFRNCIISAIILLIINQIIPIWYCYYFVFILIGDRILECLQKLLRGLKNQKLFAISGLFQTAVMVVCNMIKICVFGEGVVALLQSNILSLYLTILFILIFEKRLRKVDFKLNVKKQQKEMLAYSIPLVPSALSWWVMNASDRYIIRLVIGSAANGIYSVAYKFPSILQTFLNMFNNAWVDLVLSGLKKDKESIEYINKIFNILVKISFEVLFVLIPITKLVMNLILSNSYKEASIYIGFLYLGTLFNCFSTFCNVGYLQDKKTVGAAKTSAVGALVNVCVDLLLIRYIGLFAASISTFLGCFVMWIIRMKDMKATFSIKIRYPNFCLYLTLGVIISIVTIRSNNVQDLVLAIVFGFYFLVRNWKMIFKMLYSVKYKIRKNKL